MICLELQGFTSRLREEWLFLTEHLLAGSGASVSIATWSVIYDVEKKLIKILTSETCTKERDNVLKK